MSKRKDYVSNLNSKKKKPYRIFISHKSSAHGDAVEKLKELLSVNGTLKEKLRIYVSETDIKPGAKWRKKIHKALDKADMLLYIYCFNSPPDINDWCNYETGYFAKKSGKKNIVTIVPKGVATPSPVRGYEHIPLTYNGISRLLKIIYEKEKTYPEAFSEKYLPDMVKRIESILKIFNPGQKPIALSPRIWITIKAEAIDKITKRRISLPLKTTTISGETEAALRYGYPSIDGKEISLKKLEQKAEFKGTLPLFYEILSETIREVLTNNPGPWRVPPVRVLNEAPPNILVPAYKEKMPNGDIKIEFVVTRSPINFNYPRENLYFMDLYNLFVIAWHFRWSVLEKYIHEFSRFSPKDLVSKINQNLAKDIIEKLKVELSAVYLDSFNRRLQFPEDIIRNFEGDDKKVMRKIVESGGLWTQLREVFDTACENMDLKTIVECLSKMKNLNKTVIVKCIELLLKFTNDKMKGEVIKDF